MRESEQSSLQKTDQGSSHCEDTCGSSLLEAFIFRINSRLTNMVRPTVCVDML